MLTDTGAVRSYFAKLGLEPEIADIYLSLHAEGPQTISSLARSSGVERTKIYRLIDTLLESNLIEVESHYKRGIIKAAPISNLHILISQKEQELRSLQENLGLIEQVLARNSLSNPSTRVQFYSGKSGIKQMQWNQTHAKTELLSIMREHINDALGTTFLTRFADAINNNDIHVKLIASPQFIEQNQAWYKQEKIPEVIKHLDVRVMDPDVFAIIQNTDIWDDVTTYYDWKDGDIYGIEIYNQHIANTQRAFFEMLWEKAKG